MKVLIWLSRVVKRREFWFCVLVYPAMLLAARWLITSSISDVLSNYPLYYGFGVFFVSAAVIFGSVLEIIRRLWMHGLQGRKLHIRTDEGVEFEDIGL